MSVETFVSEGVAAGFVLERLVEPRPVATFRDIDPDTYDRLSQRPAFLAVRLRRA